MPVALAQEGSFGFGLQEDKGTFVNPTTWLPLMHVSGTDGDSLLLQKNYTLFDMADMNDYESRYYSAGEWVEGEVPLPLIPGALTNLLSWLQDRDANNQGKWASIVVDCVNEVKKLTDVKVRKATIDLIKGEPVSCVLDIAGLKMESGSVPSPSLPVAAPYIFREATIEMSKGGSPVSEEVNCERIRLVIDNAVERVSEGLRLVPSAAPQQLYNLAGVRCVGAFSRDFVDNSVYADFACGTEAALVITLARGETTAVISLPRVLYTASDMGLPGAHEQRIVEKVDFVALGSIDGLTAPVVLS
ncbi:MAG: hypothetical protein J7M38_12185 [Armatimonadetes bacterium]|nr:hypothetical protein [Armatimonadota bacterium]